MAEPGAAAGALDQAGDVGDDELALGALERAEHGLERREGVVGDLRGGARQARQQRRLARVRQPDQPDVGEQLEPQLEPALLARQALLGEARRLPVELVKRLLPRPPAPPCGDDRALARRVRSKRMPPSASSTTVPGGTADLERGRARAVALPALAVAAARRP